MNYRLKMIARSLAQESKVFGSVYRFFNVVKIHSLKSISDKTFARLNYKENTGRLLDLNNPTTFNEKLWWLKLNNRDPLMTICSDKVLVRDYVRECGLGHILNEVYGIYESVYDIDFMKLPEKAVIKTNNGSGTNYIWDINNINERNKNLERLEKALQHNYYYQSREWNYKNIVPKIIIEKYLEMDNDQIFADYKFLCFDGKVKLVFVDIEVAAKDGTHNPYAKRNVYDKDFNYMDIKASREHFDSKILEKPINYDRMIDYAETLSDPFVFCRVDLYNLEGKILFGEITFYSGGGYQIIEPECWEEKIGGWIDLKSEKIIRDL